LISSRAAADGTGGICRGSSDCKGRSAETSVCLRAGSRGANEGRAASHAFSSDFSRVGETLGGAERVDGADGADGARL
jgi:hypothetical protein